MGYFLNDTDIIVNETKTPAKVSLSNNPNFIQFESKDHVDVPVEITIQITGGGYYFDDSNNWVNISEFTILEKKTNISHVLRGTSDISEINSNTFYLGPFTSLGNPKWALDKIAESLFNALRQNSFTGNNFDITFPLVEIPEGLAGAGKLARGTAIKLKSKGSGEDYAFKITASDPKLDEDFFTVIGDPENTSDGDSIALGYNPVSVELDIYSDTGVFLGEDDSPNDSNSGTYVNTLTKSYSYTPVWFDVNILDVGRLVDFLNSDGWVNTGTVRDFRFIARRFANDPDWYDNSIFYVSNVLYMISGYNRALEANDLSGFVYDTFEGNIAKPLTNQPFLTHVKGQTQYFNFILSDPDRSKDLGQDEYNIGINYRLYTQSKKFVTEVQAQNQNRKLFNIVNTLKLDIDTAISEYDNIGIVEVYLSRSGTPISKPLVFHILPECLYKVNDFAFLNSLGGWSSFNFPGIETTDFKASANSIYKTQTPSHAISSEIESVYVKETEEQFTVQTMPIKKDVCDWLKELSSSIAVYELSTQRYIIVDELNIKPNTKDDLFRLEMKYHYSDRYNNLTV